MIMNGKREKREKSAETEALEVCGDEVSIHLQDSPYHLLSTISFSNVGATIQHPFKNLLSLLN